MGKKKQIRNLESEVEILRKNVIDREVAIDKLLSDTITDSEKNGIKLERQFDKMVQKEFDRNIIVGKIPDYSKVSEVINAGTFTPTNKQKAEIEAHRDKINFIPDKNIIVGLTATPIRNKNVEKLVNNLNLYNKETNIVDNPNFSEGFNDLPNDEVNVFHRPINHPDNIQTQGRQYRHTEEGFVLIQAPVGSFIVPPTNNPTITCHLAVIQKELQKEMDEYSDYDFARGGSIQDRIRDAEKIGDSIRSNYVELKINHGDKFHKEVEYDGHNGTIKTNITYPNADGAPKTMADIHDDINLMETIVKMPGCNLSDKEEIEILRERISISQRKLKENAEIQNKQTLEISRLLEQNNNLRTEIERLKRIIDRAQMVEKRDQLHNAIKDDLLKSITADELAERNNLPKTIESLSKINKFKYNDFTGLFIIKDIVGNWRLGNEILAEDQVVFMWVHETISPSFSVDKSIHTEKDVNVWGHNVGDVTSHKSELLDSQSSVTTDAIEEFNKHLLRESIGVITEVAFGGDLEGTVYKNSANCFVYNTEEKYRSIPFDDMYKLWKEGKVRLMETLEMCGEPQVCAPAKEEERPPRPFGYKTSEEWLAEIPSEYKVKILDPDGWDRSNYEYSFRDNCITKKEFLKRLMYSIISCDCEFWKSEWATN